MAQGWGACRAGDVERDMTQDTKRRLLTTEELKSGGFIPQRQKDLVAVKVQGSRWALDGS